MSDIIDSLTGNSMLHLKQDIAYLRQCLAECTASRDNTSVQSHTVHHASHSKFGYTCLEELT
ncbi:MAG: hypothetical protein IIX53_01905, partial [Phascolarctobacterium sp.]|nr:hypothetical protein [Phascolarctobacterium sp.]